MTYREDHRGWSRTVTKVWSQFIALSDNKSGLARFLNHYVKEHTNRLPTRCELVIEGGFEDQQSAKSSMGGDLPDLKANHDEAEIPVSYYTPVMQYLRITT